MYQVLARKYRPRNFNQLVGQTHVSKALTSALERNRLHHAYLFTGTRGVGKTTIARILSKCLNCETGITATPCETCTTCTAINEGRFIDLIEIDAASRTKVEDTRELLDNVPYAPTQGRYKVYLIDEVHMLSTHSFNALLKTLEEPPEHVKFLLATTDPQKLPVTVLSRCLQFTLRPLQQQEIHDHLADILSQEDISSDDKALWQLAEAAQGSLRDALSLTDQAIAYGQGQLQGSDVQDMLGLLDKGQLVYLMQAIYHNNGQQVSQILQNLSNQAVDLKAILDQLISLLHQLALLQHLPQVPLQGTQEYQQHLRQLAQQINPSDIQLYYQIALQGRQDLKLAVSLQQGFDMCILRMLAFKPLAPDTEIITQPVQSSKTASNNITAQRADTQGIPDQEADGQEVNVQEDDVQEADVQEADVNKDDVQEADVNKDVQDTDIQGTDIQEKDIQEKDIQNKEIQKAGIQEVAQDALTQKSIAEENAVLTSPVAPSFDLAAEATIQAQSNHPALEDTAQPLVFDQPFAEHITEQVDAQPDDFVLKSDTVIVEVESEIPFEQAVDAVEKPSPDLDHGAIALLPQQILRHKQVALTGEWDIEKWECWLREAEITPATLNLAQHGMMQGSIGGQCQFLISPEHQLMATELMDGLQQALQGQWPAGNVTLVFQSIETLLPLQLKARRYEQALQQADYLLRQEPEVKNLISQFDANLINVAFKE